MLTNKGKEDLEKTLSELKDFRDSRRKTSVTCDTSTIVEPTTQTRPVIDNKKHHSLFMSEDASLLNLYDEELSSIKTSLSHFSNGTFQEHQTDGTVVSHLAKDNYLIIEGDSFTVVSNVQEKVESNKTNHVGGSYIFKFDGDFKLYTGGTEITISGGEVSLKTSSLKVEATSVEIDALSTKLSQVIDAATRGFTSLPLCVFSGAPHSCNTAP